MNHCRQRELAWRCISSISRPTEPRRRPAHQHDAAREAEGRDPVDVALAQISHGTERMVAELEQRRARQAQQRQQIEEHIMSSHEQITATFRHIQPTEELMATIRREAEQLRVQHPGLGLVSTTLEKPDRHGRERQTLRARVELQLPGGRLVAKASAEDPHDALQGAFRTVERSVRQRVDRQWRTFARATP